MGCLSWLCCSRPVFSVQIWGCLFKVLAYSSPASFLRHMRKGRFLSLPERVFFIVTSRMAQHSTAEPKLRFSTAVLAARRLQSPDIVLAFRVCLKCRLGGTRPACLREPFSVTAPGITNVPEFTGTRRQSCNFAVWCFSHLSVDFYWRPLRFQFAPVDGSSFQESLSLITPCHTLGLLFPGHQCL